MKFTTIAAISVFAFTLFACSSPIPQAKAGPEAEALTNKILQAMNQNAWKNGTQAVEFKFQGDNTHFWDKGRGLVETRFDKVVVQFKIDLSKSVVTDAGKTITGAAAAEKTKEAYKRFINDGFWLNPAAHFRSPGTVRKITADGKLLITYTSGGVTPGDSYLVTPDKKNRIASMRMWTSVLPVKGANATFGTYAVSSTGVPFAAKHKVLGMVSVDLSDVKMYAKYPPAGGKDRFAASLR